MARKPKLIVANDELLSSASVMWLSITTKCKGMRCQGPGEECAAATPHGKDLRRWGFFLSADSPSPPPLITLHHSVKEHFITFIISNFTFLFESLICLAVA